MIKMLDGLNIYDFQHQYGDDNSCIDTFDEMK